MKSLYLSLLLSLGLAITTAVGQNYALVEHFTNTHCPICTNRNPQLFAVINKNAPNVHHIAYHPPYPYSQCIFYQANIEGNQSRADFYNVFGSPSSYVGGQRGNQGSSLLSEEKVLAQISRPLMFEMKVTESDITPLRKQNSKDINISIKTLQLPAAGEFRLFVALVEKEIDYQSPNGESKHHDVFRKMLPSNDGEMISFTTAGEEQVFNYQVDYESGWQQDQMYAVVFIQNIDDKSILGSSTKFDNVSTRNNVISDNQAFKIRNNPVNQRLDLILPMGFNRDVPFFIHGMNGQVILQDILPAGQQFHQIEVSSLPAGMYLSVLKTDEGILRKRFVKR